MSSEVEKRIEGIAEGIVEDFGKNVEPNGGEC